MVGKKERVKSPIFFRNDCFMPFDRWNDVANFCGNHSGSIEKSVSLHLIGGQWVDQFVAFVILHFFLTPCWRETSWE